MIYMIAAISKNNQIGLNHKMPWHIPEDLSYFKRITTGHPVVMGRKTYESIGHLLPNRHNIILTQNPKFSPSDVTSDLTSASSTKVDVVHSINEALALLPNDSPSFIIGGGEIYRAFLPYADKLYLTVVDKVVNGDTDFPPFEDAFKCVESTLGETKTDTKDDFTFTVWVRK